MILYVYNDEDPSKQVDRIEGADLRECERFAEAKWGKEDYWWTEILDEPELSMVVPPKEWKQWEKEWEAGKFEEEDGTYY